MKKGEVKSRYTIEEIMGLLQLNGGFIPSQRVVIASLEIVRKLKALKTLRDEDCSQEKLNENEESETNSNQLKLFENDE